MTSDRIGNQLPSLRIVLISLVSLSTLSHAFLPTPILTAGRHFSAGSQPFLNDDYSRASFQIHAKNDGEDDAKKLLDKVSQIRAEIAALEGKTVSEVEDEAKAKVAETTARREEAAVKRLEAKKTTIKPSNDGRFTPLPDNAGDQVLQAAAAVERAYRDGITRQTIRFALVPEGDAMSEVQEWPGGAQEMLREAARPLTEELLREVRAEATEGENGEKLKTTPGGIPPKVSTQDVWDFDGSAITTAQASSGPEGDVQALVLANTDVKYTKDIKKIDEAMGERLFLLINPFWRNLDSWGINIMAPRAKSMAKEVIFDRGYPETYALSRLSVRGETCAAVKAYPYDWQLFAYIEDEYWPGREVAIRLGSSVEEPSSVYFQELLNERPEFKMTKNMRQMQRMMKK